MLGFAETALTREFIIRSPRLRIWKRTSRILICRRFTSKVARSTTIAWVVTGRMDWATPPPVFPPLAQSEWVGAEHPDRIIRIILNGLSGPVEVEGRSFGQAVMPTWRSDSSTALAKLSDEDLAGVITYIRNTWGNKASPVTPPKWPKSAKTPPPTSRLGRRTRSSKWLRRVCF